MEHCPTCGSKLKAPSTDDPIIYRSTSAKEGGCSFCNRWVTARGSVDHEVTVVKANFNGCTVVRFCDPCAAAFRKGA